MNNNEVNMESEVCLVDPESSVQAEDRAMSRLYTLAPRPVTVDDTGLSPTFLAELLAKHLLEGGVLTLPDLSRRIALAGPIVESVLNFMRSEAQIEVRGAGISSTGNGSAGALRYCLTDRGRQAALDATQRSGYVGPAPIPLNDYLRISTTQSIHGNLVTHADMQRAFADIVLRESVLHQLGPALNSGRAIFIYGPAGTGKTYITQRLVRLFSDVTLIPHAIEVNGSVVEVFDPVVHRPINAEQREVDLMYSKGFDPRYACCWRPVVISGGELTADMLEVHFDADTRRYRAPLQMKANNGIFIIDDMGRQRVEPEVVFNRWIVPLEEKKDYLTLGAGRHFSVPFDTVLVFSTNLHPLELADEAFLRRIGYKIEFTCLRVKEYEQIWQQYCLENNISCEADVFDYVVHELYGQDQRSLLACHPRDLLGMAADRAIYEHQQARVTTEHMRWAWANYFVSMKPGKQNSHTIE